MKQIIMVVGLLFALTWRPSPANGAELTRIRIGYPSPSASFSPLFDAHEAKLFQKYGRASELLYLQGIQITQVHVAGHVDFTVTGAPLPMRAAVEGADPVLAASSIDEISQTHPNAAVARVQAKLGMIAERNPKARNRKPEEFMDTSLMAELDKSGFLQSVWK